MGPQIPDDDQLSMKGKDIAQRIRTELAYYRMLAENARTPWLSKVLIGVAVAYLLSPVDIIPDFIPILGHLDDVLLVPGLIWLAVSLIPSSVKAEARAAVSIEPANDDQSGGHGPLVR